MNALDSPMAFDTPKTSGAPQPSPGSVLNGQPTSDVPIPAPSYDGQPFSSTQSSYPHGAPVGQGRYDPYGPSTQLVPSSPNSLSYPATNGYAEMSFGYAVGYGAPAQRTCGTAIASMIIGIAAMLFFLIPLIPVFADIAAVACGHIALSQIKNAAPGTLSGRGMAIAGLILGYVGLGLAILSFIAVLLLPVIGVSLFSWIATSS